jgi:putative inorganic carbon (HCO3(-)) transporter
MGMDKARVLLYCDRIIEYSLYAMAFFIPISKAIIEITCGIAIVAFLAKKIIEGRAPSTPLNLPLAAFVLFCAFSVAGSDSFNTSLRNFFGRIIQDVLLFFAVVEGINTRQKIKNILFILLASAILTSVCGITQHFTRRDFLRGRTMPFKKRINAPFYTPNDLGAYLVPIIVIALALNFTRFKNKVIAYALKLVPIVLLAALIMTFSRGAWVSFICGIIFMSSIALLLKRRDTLLLLFLLALVIVISVPLRKDIPLTKIFDLTDAGSIDRKGLWTIAWNMIKAKPIFGQGIGAFMHNFRKYNTIGYIHGVSYAHNCYLQLAAEIGIVGLLAFLWIIIRLFRVSLKKILEAPNGIDYLLLGFISGLAAFLIHSSVETNFYSGDIGTLFWLLLGLCISASNFLRTNPA